VLEVLREEKSVSEIASREGINPNQIGNWKRELIENVGMIFRRSEKEEELTVKLKEVKEKEREYMAKVGELTLEVDWLKKNLNKFLEKGGKAALVSQNEELPVKRQCELLELSRSSYYYAPKEVSEAEREREEHIKKRIDYWHTKYCYMGRRKILDKLKKDDKIERIGRKLVRRYMGEMGIYAVYPKPNLSKPDTQHMKFPYLLRNKPIFLPNQVWAADITYISYKGSHMYLTAIIDWHSRYIVGWELSDTLETATVLAAVSQAISHRW